MATTACGEDAEVVRTGGAALIVERDGGTISHRLTTLRAAAEIAGVHLDAPLFLGGDARSPMRPTTSDRRRARTCAATR